MWPPTAADGIFAAHHQWWGTDRPGNGIGQGQGRFERIKWHEVEFEWHGKNRKVTVVEM
jgi:hypothetical protein